MARAALNKRFEDLFRLSRSITAKQLAEAIKEIAENNEYLHQKIVDKQWMEASRVLELVQQELKIETIDFQDNKDLADLDPDFVKSVFPEPMTFRIQSLPLHQTEDTLFIAMVDPFDVFILNEIRVRLHSRYKIKAFLAFPKDITNKLNEIFEKTEEDSLEKAMEGLEDIEGEELEMIDGVEDEEDEDLETVALEQAQQAPVIRAVTKLIFQAVREGASDIHIEPYPRDSILRYRIDGTLYEKPMPSHTWHNAIVSRIKIMSGRNIAEHRIPQDGRYGFRLGNKKYELRISIIPTVFGKESVVMRILDKSGITIPLSELGFSQENLKLFDNAIHKPYGLILVCGPTGSGKTTTLFAALNTINDKERKILTVENPVEYNLPGIVQVQTNEDMEPPLDFAWALKSFLRQDPDVIMVGEIRDPETATTATEAALTGHLVFSTLHTNDAPTTVTRLAHLEVDPFLIGDSVLLIIAQRLPRTICKKCKVLVKPTEEQLKLFEAHKIDTSNLQLSRGEGCDQCNGKGLKGRMAIHEAMIMNDAIKDLIIEGSSAHEIKRAAIANGMKTLRYDGLVKATKGLVTTDEILGITQDN